MMKHLAPGNKGIGTQYINNQPQPHPKGLQSSNKFNEVSWEINGDFLTLAHTYSLFVYLYFGGGPSSKSNHQNDYKTPNLLNRSHP